MNPTLQQLLASLSAVGKKVSKRTLQRYLVELAIGPAGKPQKPNRYPADTLARLQAYLGLVASATATAPTANPEDDTANGFHGLLSLKAIKARAASKANQGVIL